MTPATLLNPPPRPQPPPVIVCGDFNSLPRRGDGGVHDFWTLGRGDATEVRDRIWNFYADEALADAAAEALPDKEGMGRRQPRYILDYTLNRLCRWLRLLGLDAALETEEEEVRGVYVEKRDELRGARLRAPGALSSDSHFPAASLDTISNYTIQYETNPSFQLASLVQRARCGARGPGARIPIFDRCRDERRALVTTSSR